MPDTDQPRGLKPKSARSTTRQAARKAVDEAV